MKGKRGKKKENEGKCGWRENGRKKVKKENGERNGGCRGSERENRGNKEKMK